MFFVFFKSRKVFLPLINLNKLKPVSSLLTPKDLIIPMVLVSILAQIIDNSKYIFTVKEIQKLPSVKFYSKMIMFGNSSVSLSIIYAISNTLSSEIEILSNLSSLERFSFLSALKDSLFLEQKTLNQFYNCYNSSVDLLRLRKNFSLQFRSALLSSSLLYPGSLVVGLPISEIDLKLILESCKIIWCSLGLIEEDFNFMLIKECFTSINFPTILLDNISEIECVKMLCALEFNIVRNFIDFLVFEKDFFVLNSSSNLVKVEEDLGFLRRSYSESFK